MTFLSTENDLNLVKERKKSVQNAKVKAVNGNRCLRKGGYPTFLWITRFNTCSLSITSWDNLATASDGPILLE